MTNGYTLDILLLKVYPSYIREGRKPMDNFVIQKEKKYMVQTNIRRWGNSQGIRLSREIMSQMNLKENDMIGISICDGKMTIEKINQPKYLNLQERLESFYNRPIDEIYVESAQEVDMGDPIGNEYW